MIWVYICHDFDPKPFGQVQARSLEGKWNICVCSSYTFLIEKLLTLPLLRLLITCEMYKKCNYYSLWNITLYRLLSDLSKRMYLTCSLVENCILNELGTINWFNDFLNMSLIFQKLTIMVPCSNPILYFKSPKLIGTVCVHVFT